MAAVLLTGSFYLLTAGINKMQEFKFIGLPQKYVNTVSVSADGKVTAVPDILKASFGYTATKKSVADAQKETVDKMNAFMAVLKNKGVEDKDIRTTQYDIYPQYDYVDGRQSLSGYTVTQSIEVKFRKFEDVSSILTLAADNALNQVGNLQFTFDDMEKYLQEARLKAIAAAKDKAAILASQANISLGKVINFYENGPLPYYDSFGDKGGMGGGGLAATPQISAGSNEITVSVSLTYEVL